MLKSLNGDFSRQSGKEKMLEALGRHGGRIGVVYAHNDEMALGAIEEAVKDLAGGREGGRELPMKIITAGGFFSRETAKKALTTRDY
ncbi:hypothetical protein [Paenibacillus soyae]|uniref:Periplasmic binding protein domain-containing protein n=1 Tax=Paenibacillus soyae TaxID=2969249 RepID=A0A9X2S7S5_9BACL|nr:hypothetical protein [Paenibacillus soyae]MCR2803376.1 hypothetical protein [Paenibacillus soyae]